MLKSSLKAPSSIDHDLFPLLKVRTCVSEADESKNGPRFCAEDKMSGAAYEVRSRKLELMKDASDVAQDGAQPPHQLSSQNLQTIRRQQARIDALMSASAHGVAPPSVALPIDMYIQEQPSSGDTYVASVDAFAGLSLGDIIRSGWGVMEEQVFLEILNAVESYGYASASLPPHGNLSSDAIKQLLIVRDGASEARQPSRWVVSDWLLLSDDAVDGRAFDVEAFMGDLEWMLHSSFAQLRISTSLGGAYLAAVQVEDVVNETVERIRTFLVHQAAETAAGASCGQQEAHSSSQAVMQSEATGNDTAAGEVASQSGTVAQHTPAEGQHIDEKEEQSDESAATPARRDSCSTDASPNPSTATLPPRKTAAGERGIRNGTRQSRNSPREPHDVSSGVAKDTTRNMTLKDKMAYHQAALRNEQLLVNKQRRKNAPLPPRPTPAVNSARKSSYTTKSSADRDDVYDDVPPLGMLIEVKPSAFLMQSRRGSAASNLKSPGAAPRKLQSPRSACAPNNESRTPRDGSRSSNAMSAPTQPQSLSYDGKASQPATIQRQQQQQQSLTPRDQQRERLLDDVVNMAVMNQRRRGQCFRMQQEADRKRREQRQYVLEQNTPRRNALERTIPAMLEQPRVAGAASSAASSAATPTSIYEQPRTVVGRRSGTALTGIKDPKGDKPTASAAINVSADVAPAASADDWPANLSQSPEPVPPSPFARRVVQHTAAAPVRGAPTTGNGPYYQTTPLGTPRGRGGVAAGHVDPTRLDARTGRTGTGAPLTRLLRPTIGQKPRGKAAATVPGAGTVHEAQPFRKLNSDKQLGRSARGGPSAASRPGALRSAKAATHIPVAHTGLSARGKVAPPTVSPTNDALKARQPPQQQQQQQQQPAPTQGLPTPYVRPLPLATLTLRHNSISGSPPAPNAAESTRAGNSSPHQPDASLSNTLNAGKSSRESPQRLLQHSPRPGGVSAGGGRGSPRAPHTARAPPPQPALSPRGYRRVASTGALQSGPVAAKTRMRGGPRVLPLPNQDASAQALRSGRRGGPGTRVAAAGKVVPHSPRPVLRKVSQVEGDRVFPAVNRTPMRRLVPEKVCVSHVAAEAAQRAPQATPQAALTTPRNRPTTGKTRTAAGWRQTTAAAARQRGPLTLGSVRPVDETSPGILLRHHRRQAS